MRSPLRSPAQVEGAQGFLPQPYMNRELPDVHAGFRKGRGTRDQIANMCWIIEKAKCGGGMDITDKRAKELE